MKHIVLLGGGSGISNLIRAFVHVPEWSISAVVATSDSGGSTGIIRNSYNIPAIGDLVKNLAALDSEKNSWMTYRHQDGFLAGHTTGNLWLLGLIKHYGMSEGIKKAHEFLGYTKHQIIPATESTHDVEIKTTHKTITGEGNIIQSEDLFGKIKSVRLLPETKASKGAINALKRADIIIIGPGTLYTSIIASLLPIGIKETILASKAKKIFIANAANFPRGHCNGYTLDMYLQELSRLVGVSDFTAILAHDGSNITKEEEILVNKGKNITCINCLDTPDTLIGGKFDSIKRNTLRHDGKKVVQWIKKIFN